MDIAVTGGGSGTGIAALINGTVDLANASREMKDQEIEDAKKNGIDPVEHQVAVDALAVIVNLDNPVSQLTIDQLADILHRQDHKLEGCRRQRRSDRADLAGDQLRYPCLLPGASGAQG